MCSEKGFEYFTNVLIVSILIFELVMRILVCKFIPKGIRFREFANPTWLLKEKCVLQYSVH